MNFTMTVDLGTVLNIATMIIGLMVFARKVGALEQTIKSHSDWQQRQEQVIMRLVGDTQRLIGLYSAVLRAGDDES